MAFSGVRPNAILTFSADSVGSTTLGRFLAEGQNNGMALSAAFAFEVPDGGLARNFRVRQRTPAGNGGTIRYIFRKNLANTLLVIDIASTATSGSDLTNTVVLGPGELVDVVVLKPSGSIGVSPRRIVCSVEVTI